MSNPESVGTSVGFIGVSPVSSVTTSDVIESPHEVLFEQGGTYNGKPFDSIASLFEDLGCTIIDSSGGGYTNPLEPAGFTPCTGKAKKKILKARKSERQRRKRGRK